MFVSTVRFLKCFYKDNFYIILLDAFLLIYLFFRLEGKAGLIDTSVDSKQIKAVAQVEWVWKWMENIWSNLNASYTYNSTTKDIYSKLYLWNPKGKFGEITFGTDVSFNAKSWWYVFFIITFLCSF